MSLARYLLLLITLSAMTSVDASACCPCSMRIQQDEAESATSKPPTDQDATKPLPTIAKKTDGMERREGFFTYYWDARRGKILLQIPSQAPEFLYVHSLATGLGSNPVGLDRGQLGDNKVVQFERVGPKVLLLQRNLRFRANTDNELEQRAVEQSFAQSAIWGGEVIAESEDAFLVDLTSLLLSDVHGVSRTLTRTKQGEFSLDQKRSAVYLPRCRAFPDNTELEATLTFAGKKPGDDVQQTTPTPTSITLRQHHSLIKLPDDGYRPRVYDVRSPCIFITFADYASPLDQPLEHRWITRHRLIKQDPAASVSEPVEPIVYYVDAGAPKQIQAALIEGASWWNEAFESAGFKNAFRVELLPPDADPLDVRYNVIQWVHRSTRGWSYGGSVIDPRTGEIIKGHVTLGSLRVRQDQLLVNGLQPSENLNAACACCGAIGISEESTLVDMDPASDPLSVALARIRQLSAHEVGHTLGFVHNFAASTYGDRASVMDYPAPRVKITEQQTLDLSDAYGVGIGAWDKVAVQFAYSQFAPGADESNQLDQILDRAAAESMIFVSDADARPASAAHPLGNLWDNGTEPLGQLNHVMRVRRIAMDNFDPDALPERTTTADIAQFFTPLYLHHRYQLKAAGKLVGGHVYQYGYAGDEPTGIQPIDAGIQQQAIDALLSTIHPRELAIRADIIRLISPKPYNSIRDRELLPGQSGRIFDPLAAARVAVDLTLDELLQPQRLARLTIVSQDTPTLSPRGLVNQIVSTTWNQKITLDQVPSIRQLSRVVRQAITDDLIALAEDPQANSEVHAAAILGLEQIKRMPTNLADGDERSFRSLQQRKIDMFLQRPYPVFQRPKPLAKPPGDPIGG